MRWPAALWNLSKPMSMRRRLFAVKVLYDKHFHGGNLKKMDNPDIDTRCQVCATVSKRLMGINTASASAPKDEGLLTQVGDCYLSHGGRCGEGGRANGVGVQEILQHDSGSPTGCTRTLDRCLG